MHSDVLRLSGGARENINKFCWLNDYQNRFIETIGTVMPEQWFRWLLNRKWLWWRKPMVIASVESFRSHQPPASIYMYLTWHECDRFNMKKNQNRHKRNIPKGKIHNYILLYDLKTQNYYQSSREWFSKQVPTPIVCSKIVEQLIYRVQGGVKADGCTRSIDIQRAQQSVVTHMFSVMVPYTASIAVSAFVLIYIVK